MTTQPQERDIEAALEWLRSYDYPQYEHARVLLAEFVRLRAHAQPSPRGVALEKALRTIDRLASHKRRGFAKEAQQIARRALASDGREGCEHDYVAHDDKGWECKKCGHQT